MRRRERIHRARSWDKDFVFLLELAVFTQRMQGVWKPTSLNLLQVSQFSLHLLHCVVCMS